jgi:hypothetical protein
MKEQHNKSVSLLELLIAITLLSVIVLSLTSIDIFTRNHVISSDRRARLQNQMYYVIEHISREISKAIGNEYVYGTNTVVDQQVPAGSDEHARVRVYVDGNGDGIRQEPQNNPAANEDHWIAYYFYDNGAPSNRNTIRYCSRCRNRNNPCGGGGGGNCITGWVTLSSNIKYFIPTVPATGNYLDVEIIGCHDPTVSDTNPDISKRCGSIDNPIVRLHTNIKMPSVAAR